MDVARRRRPGWWGMVSWASLTRGRASQERRQRVWRPRRGMGTVRRQTFLGLGACRVSWSGSVLRQGMGTESSREGFAVASFGRDSRR
jgi:hypothetical protein